jgi:hypothetical protein
LAWQLPILLIALVALGLAAAALALPPTPAEALATAPVRRQTYQRRLLSLSLEGGTRLLLASYFFWSAAVYIFMGLYPSWAVAQGLAGHGAGMIGTVLFLGEVGGLLGAFLSSRLAAKFRHPTTLCAIAAMCISAIVLSVPFGVGSLMFQTLAYMGFAFGRDLMLALILGGAMLLVAASQRGSLNAILNAIYQTGGTVGGMASAWLYALSPDFAANSAVAGGFFATSGLLLWGITRVKTPLTSADSSGR